MKSTRVLRLAAAVMAILLAAGNAQAQSKGETSLYKKTVAKGNMKAIEKFLKKYPQSVYAPQVQQMKDSLLYIDFQEANVSRIAKADAVAVAKQADAVFADAVGWKKDGTEHILALKADAGTLTLQYLTPDGTPESSRSIPVYTLEAAPEAFALADSLQVVTPLGKTRNYLHFSYRNGAKEYVEVLWLPEEDLNFQALFYGTPLPDGRIEGQSPEMIEGLSLAAETALLVQRLRENPALKPIDKADLLTDESIRWWLEKNPRARTSATKLSFGKLDPASSLADACRKARKEKGKSSSAAIFDIRGYTVICTVSYKTGECTLVWAEPICRNRSTDAYIRSIYFENDGLTLDVVYYKGKTTFKNKISLANQGLWHLK